MSQPRRRNGQFARKLPKAPEAAKFKPTANPAYAQGIAEIRRSNAAGTHEDRRTRRARSRSDAKRRALGEQAD